MEQMIDRCVPFMLHHMDADKAMVFFAGKLPTLKRWAKYLTFYLLAVIFFAAGCSNRRQTDDRMTCIDVMRTYPEKEILLSDIGDITYLQLKSDRDEYLFKGVPVFLAKNTLVIHDESSGSLLFFSRDGNPKSRFNRRGNGPEEYVRVNQVVYDEEKDEIFVAYGNVIQVYSSDGRHMRKISLPAGTVINPVISFDENSLFLYDASVQRRTSDTERTASGQFASPFVRISKTDGKVLEYVELPTAKTELGLYREVNGTRMMVRGLTHRLIKCDGGVLLCNPETDTVFFYGKDKSLTPIVYKTPPVTALDPIVYLNNCVDAGRFQFMEVYTVRFEEGALPYPVTYLMRDKETGEIFRQKIVLPDYREKSFFISPRKTGRDYGNGTLLFELDLIELAQAYGKNMLSGQLKELVASSNYDEDNNIYVLLHFK
jgi:hypothetical protein